MSLKTKQTLHHQVVQYKMVEYHEHLVNQLTYLLLIGLRDAHGIRPYCIGQLGDEGFVLSSETCGLDSIGAKYMRDVKPGEMVVIDKEGLHSYQLKKGEEKLDIF